MYVTARGADDGAAAAARVMRAALAARPMVFMSVLLRSRASARSPHGRGAREGELLVLLRARGAADADAPHDLAVHDDGDAALQRREVHRGHRVAALADHLLEEARRLLEERGSA